jgi:hypothetical protein
MLCAKVRLASLTTPSPTPTRFEVRDVRTIAVDHVEDEESDIPLAVVGNLHQPEKLRQLVAVLTVFIVVNVIEGHVFS